MGLISEKLITRPVITPYFPYISEYHFIDFSDDTTMQNLLASKRALTLCRVSYLDRTYYYILTKSAFKLFRSQPTISRNVIFTTSQSRLICTRRPISHILSSTHIGTFPKRQTHSKDYSSGFRTDSLPPASPEQKRAIDKLINGSGNVVINACAGSGKTTTILLIAAAGNKTILVFMYNRRIMEETISRVKSLRIEKTTVYTYHSFGCEFYSSECFTNEGLKRVLADDMQPQKPLPQFDILALDEQQDMNPIFYNFVRKIIKDRGSWPQFLILGDPHQEIYTFGGSDKRFLSLAKDLFQNPHVGGVKTDWTNIEQMISYRMPKLNVKFVNEQVLRPPKGEEILAVKSDETIRPRYVICDGLSDGPLNEILRLISLGLSPSQIIVLAPSVRSKRAKSLRHLANQLALRLIPVHISTYDKVEISPLVTQGKIIFATYHQAKGIEREAAIVFGFDDSYTLNRPKLQSADNPQYVAVTRARTHLVLIHDYRYEYLPFIDRKTLPESCEMVELQDIEVVKGFVWRPPGLEVTGLTRNVSEQVISDCFAMLELRQVGIPRWYRDWPVTEIEVREGIWECVANITGTAIPAIYESRVIYESKTAAPCVWFSGLFKKLQKEPLPGILNLLPLPYIERLRSLEKKASTGALDIADILYLVNVSKACRSGYIVEVLSIPFDKYTWFTEAHTMSVYNTLKKYIPTSITYEKEVRHMFSNLPVDKGRAWIYGRMDISANLRVWELKWAKATRPEDVLQLELYGAITIAKISKALDERIKSWQRLILINVPLNQVIEVKPKKLEGGKDAILEVLQRLVAAKTEQSAIRLDNKEFLEEAAGGFKNSIGKVTVPPWLSHVGKKRAP